MLTERVPAGNTSKALALLTILRPGQWTKNLFVFMPAFFGGRLLDASAFLPCLVTFAAFCLSASGIYCLNDVCDAEADKAHPEKRKRPVASGAISAKAALAASAVCFLLSMSALFFLGGSARYELMAFVAFYCVMNIAYCVKLKQYAIVDVVIVAVGFVLRVWAGGIAASVKPSEWLIIMTFLLALFLAFAKRRDDVVRYQNTGVSHRKNTAQYNLEFMNQIITVIAAVTIVAYIMYTLSPDVIEYFNGRHVYFTAVFVLMGIIRYLQITIVDLKSGSPEKILLRDRFIQCCILGWIGLFGAIIYL
jgi:4-hydroxybenzoate polyprenyltransferase